MACVNNDLLVELECPVCTEFMSPPIRQCVVGHSFCDYCYQKVPDCPTCRKPKGLARSFALEKMYQKLNIPCRNRFDGCNTVKVGANIKDHEKFCYYGERNCPLKEINNCTWFGKMKRIVEHCRDEHPNNVFVANKQKLTCGNMSSYVSRRSCYYVLFESYEQLFKCCWEVEESGLMKWCVYYLGPPKDAHHFYFEVEIVNQVSPAGKSVCLTASCRPHPIDKHIFNFENCMLTHYDMIANYCKNDELMYEVRIKVDGLKRLFEK